VGGDQGFQKLGSFIIHYFKITRFIAHSVKLTLHYVTWFSPHRTAYGSRSSGTGYFRGRTS